MNELRIERTQSLGGYFLYLHDGSRRLVTDEVLAEAQMQPEEYFAQLLDEESRN